MKVTETTAIVKIIIEEKERTSQPNQQGIIIIQTENRLTRKKLNIKEKITIITKHMMRKMGLMRIHHFCLNIYVMGMTIIASNTQSLEVKTHRMQPIE